MLVTASALAAPEACERVTEAAQELESAATELARCAAKQDVNNDCHGQVREVRDAAEEYEQAIQDADDQFDGDASEVCAPRRYIPINPRPPGR